MRLKKIFIILISKVVNYFFDFYTGGKRRPVFFDIIKTAPALNTITCNSEIIKAEVANLLASGEVIKKYHELDSLQHKISALENPDKNWKVYMLYMMGEFSPSALQNCPQTCELLNEVPDIYQCFFSILEAGKNIPEHSGMYRGYLRYHLGLIVPEKDPPFLIIKNQKYNWIKSTGVLFDDSWNHSVVNNCREDRIVLVVDIYRPMPGLPDKVNRLLTKYLIKKFYAEKVLNDIDKEFKERQKSD